MLPNSDPPTTSQTNLFSKYANNSELNKNSYESKFGNIFDLIFNMKKPDNHNDNVMMEEFSSESGQKFHKREKIYSPNRSLSNRIECLSLENESSKRNKSCNKISVRISKEDTIHPKKDKE